MFFHTKTDRSDDFFHDPKTNNPYHNGGYQFSPEIRNDLPQRAYQRLNCYIHFSAFVYFAQNLTKKHILMQAIL